MAMTMNDIIELIKGLAKSQGLYGRTYEELMEMKENDQDAWDEIVKDWEGRKFETAVEFINWFEEGDEYEEDLQETLEDIIESEVQSYSRSDYSDTVYIYNDLAYIGETGYDNMIEQIKEDFNLNEDD